MKITLVGDGWGAKALYRGFANKDYKEIQIFTEDIEIKEQAFKDNILVLQSLEDIENNLVICAGYKKIIKKDFLIKNDVLNIHYSLLPKYRGFHSTVWAILNNEKFLGLSIHKMTEYIDAGDILVQYKVKNIKTKTSVDYMNEFNSYIEKNIFDIIRNYISGKIICKKQNKKEASWVGKRNIEDCKIDFNLKINDLKNLFRALVAPYPLPYIEIKGERYNILDVDFHSSNCKAQIGRVVNIDNEGVYIQIRDGYIILKNLKQGNEIYKANELLKKIGIRL